MNRRTEDDVLKIGQNSKTVIIDYSKLGARPKMKTQEKTLVKQENSCKKYLGKISLEQREYSESLNEKKYLEETLHKNINVNIDTVKSDTNIHKNLVSIKPCLDSSDVDQVKKISRQSDLTTRNRPATPIRGGIEKGKVENLRRRFDINKDNKDDMIGSAAKDVKRLKIGGLKPITSAKKSKKNGRGRVAAMNKIDPKQSKILDFYRGSRGQGGRGGSPRVEPDDDD